MYSGMFSKRRFQTLAATVVLLYLALTLYRGYLRRNNRDVIGSPNAPPAAVTATPVAPQHRLPLGNATYIENAPKYIDAILNPEDNSFDRLQCTRPNVDRYAYLQSYSPTGHDAQRKRYYFALLLHQCVGLLPRLMGSIVETIRFLGPENCALSIVEGRSDDGTYEILRALQTSLDEMGVQYFFESSDLDTANERIEKLALLRNMALAPLHTHKDQFSESSTIIFLNDVAACPDDILELIHQRVYQAADMTCAMDWNHPGEDPLFYDVWIARGITGNTFFEILEDGSWDRAADLFWNDEATKSRLDAFKPFQVFACWNGGAAFTAKPVIRNEIEFRVSFEGECFQGEPQLFCKDLWVQGYRRIAVIPSINLQYTDEMGKRIKQQKGYVAQLIQNEDEDHRISWHRDPPEQVKCMPSFNNQFFKPWNEGFIGRDRIAST